MTLLQLFYRFLKINNIYNLFLYNIQNIEHIAACKSFFLISDAFTWGDTKEGHSFWFNFNKRWEQIILYYALKLSKYEPFDSLLSNREIKINDKLIKMLKV